MTDKMETIDSSEWFDAKMVKAKSTVFGGVVVLVLCFIAVFSNIAFGGVSTGVLGLVSVLMGLLIIFWMLDSWKSKEIIISTNFLLLPFLGLILIGLIQLLPLYTPEIPDGLLSVDAVRSFSLDPYSTRFAILKLLIYFVFFAASLTFINNQRRLRKVAVTIIIFGSLMAFFGIIQRLASPEFIYGIREVGQAIPFASYINQHHFAAFLEMTIGLTLGILFGGATKKDKFLLLTIAVILMGIAIVFTGSRGGMLSLLGVIGFLLIVNLFKTKTKVETSDESEGIQQNAKMQRLVLVGGSAALMVILLVSVVWLGGGKSVERGIGLQTEQQDFTSGRTHFWSVALNIFRDNPVIGAGLESFGVAYTKYDTRNGRFRVEQAHNEYLQTLADAGILGLICVFAFIFLLFKQGFKVVNSTSDHFRRNVAIGSLAGCFGIIIHSFFDFPLRTNANMFFFLILVTLAVNSINYPKLYRKRVKMKKAA